MDNETDPTNTLSSQDRKLSLYWSIAMIFFFALVGIWVIARVRHDKISENQRIQAIIESPTLPLGAAYDEAPPPGQEANPVDVQVGVYLNQIPDFSMRDFFWIADLFIWFQWTGDRLNPGESFEIMDGNITFKEKVAETVEGDTHYARYRVVAEIHQFFDVARFPLNEFVLTIGVKDRLHPVYQLRYVADAQNSGASPRLRVLEGISLSQQMSLVKLFPYQTTFGDPSLPEDNQPTYSLFLHGLWLTSPGLPDFLIRFLEPL